jgi:ketosteroid isomerase-like protein
MADTKTIIEQAYSAFNKRDIDGALALMTQDVSWPKASEGGRVVGNVADHSKSRDCSCRQEASRCP